MTPRPASSGRAGVLATTDVLRRVVAERCVAGERPFLLGGCCTLLAGALAGARDALGLVGLVYVDGHLDFYDGPTSPTGEAADMPVAVCSATARRWVERVAPVPVAPASAIAILGYHDPAELDDLAASSPIHRQAGLFDADADAIRRDGPAATARAALAHVVEGRPVWLHVDLDVLARWSSRRPTTYVPGGLDWDELVELLRPVATDPTWSAGRSRATTPRRTPTAPTAAPWSARSSRSSQA